MAEYETLLVETNGAVTLVRLNRPQALNALNSRVLKDIVAALDSSGEQRPPGLLIVGWAVLSLHGSGDVTVLDSEVNEAKDYERVRKWLSGKPWLVNDGLDPTWDMFLPNIRSKDEVKT